MTSIINSRAAMKNSSENFRISKLTAAQKQLRAAIRMFFAKEDDLALHTVASAAYGILSNLKTSTGQDEVADYYLTAIFYIARDYRFGTLPRYFTEDAEAMNAIREISEQLPIDDSTSIQEVALSVSPDAAREFWNRRNRVANFLKHANRDANSEILLGELDNFHLLMQAASAYVDLGNIDDLGAEGLILIIYAHVTSGDTEGLHPRLQDMAAKLEPLAISERLGFCSAAIRIMNERTQK